MTTALHAIAFKAQTHPRHRFQNLYGLLNSELLIQSWGQINKRSAPGVDGVTAANFKQGLSNNIDRLSRALKHKCYRANGVKRVLIPKANGNTRPLGLPTLDDKIVQQSVSQILESIWEQDFLRNSYGYRPNKSAHQAIKSLQLNLQYKGYGYVIEADIKGFFDHMDHDWLMDMLRHRIEDKALLGLIGQWLKARIQHPEGHSTKPDSGTPQGGVISPVLANIYLHYALDLWFEKRVKPKLEGRAMLIRYADDFVVSFQYKQEAEAFYEELPKRLKRFNLDVAPEKTRLKRFSRFHPGREHSFHFLGFEFYWGVDRKGEPRLRRQTSPKKHKSLLSELGIWIKLKHTERLRDLMPQLKRKLAGVRNYFGLPDNSRSISRIYDFALERLYKWLNRRSQRRSYNWRGFKDLLRYFGIQPLRVTNRNVAVDWY